MQINRVKVCYGKIMSTTKASAPGMNKFALFLMRLLCIGMFLAGCYIFIRGMTKGNLFEALFSFLGLALPLAAISGFLFYKYFLTTAVDGIVDSMFLSRRYLKEAPFALSPYYGALANGQYNKVIQDLGSLKKKEFYYPEVIYLYSQACMQVRGRTHEALDVMEDFFRSHGKRDLTLLMFYADAAKRFRPASEICKVLHAEEKKSGYSSHEKKMIHNRYTALQKEYDL